MDKVIWSEGMFLRPQHFQQHDRYLESQMLCRVRHLAPFCWGISRLEIDGALLSVGKLAVAAIEGVFLDGALFKHDYNSSNPLILQLDKSHENQTIFLTIPALVRDSVESEDRIDAQFGKVNTRYRAVQSEIRDSHGMNNSRVYPIATGVLNMTLLAEGQLDDSLIALPIARVEGVSGEGEVTLDSVFSGPVLDVAVSRHILSSLAGLVELMKIRAAELASTIGSGGGNGSGTIVDLLMLKALNMWGAEFTVLLSQSPLHPYDLFKRLVSFNAEVSTYGHEHRLPSIDFTYHHPDATAILSETIKHASVLVSTVFESTAMSLQVRRKRFGISIVGLPSQSLADTAEFILAVKADLSSDNIRHLVSSKLKVGSIENIKNLVNLQLPGCVKEVLPVTPRQIPYHSGMNYFRLSPDDEMKASIKRSSGLGVHVSGDIPGIELECWVIPHNTQG